MTTTEEQLNHDEASQAVQPKLPNMNEFSPGVVDTNNIKQFLAPLLPFDGQKGEMIKVLAVMPKIAQTADLRQRSNRANNILIGMSQCGLLKKQGNRITGEFTDLAKKIVDCSTDLEANKSFAIYLLQECHGLELFDAVSVIRGRGEVVSLQSIREELRSRGFKVTENEGNASKMRLWLESVGIVDNEWVIDDAALHSLLGATFSTISKWSGLSRSQRIFLEKIKHLQIDDNWLTVRQIKNITELEYGRSIFPEGHLRRLIIDPLVSSEWIEAEGIGSGRGGDSGRVRALPQLMELKISLPLDTVTSVPIDLRDKLSKPLNEIFTMLNSPDTYTKGLALELLSLRVARDIGLFPVCFRERSAKTQGAEVDIIANGVHLHYSRWLLQCKNTSTVHVSDIAKEVGMAVVLKAQVIAIVTTGKIGSTVRKYADGLAATSTFQAVLIDGDMLGKYRLHGANAIIDHLKVNAYRVLKQKEPQILEYQEE